MMIEFDEYKVKLNGLTFSFSGLENTAPPYAGDFWYGNLVSNTMLPQPASSAFSVTLGNNYNYHLYGKFYFAGNCE